MVKCMRLLYVSRESDRFYLPMRTTGGATDVWQLFSDLMKRQTIGNLEGSANGGNIL